MFKKNIKTFFLISKIKNIYIKTKYKNLQNIKIYIKNLNNTKSYKTNRNHQKSFF